MFDFQFDQILSHLYSSLAGNIEIYLPKVIGAFVTFGFGIIIAIGVYKFIVYFFKKFKLIELIDKITINHQFSTLEDEEPITEAHKKKEKKLSSKIKIDDIVAKSLSYYIVLVFFRFAIVIIGINDVEVFMNDLLAYLPSLFIWIVIGFFGIRFSNFIYNVVYHTLSLTKQKTSKIVASGAKIIILFFTLMLVLKYIKIVDPFIINTILVGFISMLTISWWLAFWLGGKDIAKEILEWFRK